MSGARLSGGAATPAALASARRIEQARADGTQLVRVAAAKWQAGLAALLGVVVGGWAFGFGQELRAISSPWDVLIAAAFAVAVVLSLYAMWLSLRASGGLPRPHRTKNLDLGALDHEEATASAGYLAAAIWWSVPAMFVYLVAVAGVWFVPRDSAANNVVLMRSSGTEWCGEISAVIGDVVFISPAWGNATRISLDQIQSFEPVADCG